jgi:hypothetical protein
LRHPGSDAQVHRGRSPQERWPLRSPRNLGAASAMKRCSQCLAPSDGWPDGEGGELCQDHWTQHRCGEPRTEHPEWYCLTCGCWNDVHPGACAVSDCVCTNLHLQGYPSRKEYEKERRKAKGHYIVQAPPPASHYCEKPSTFYARPGEIWQCDICHQKWKFRRSLLDRLAMVQGDWSPTR